MFESSSNRLTVPVLIQMLLVALGLVVWGGCARLNESPATTSNGNSFSIARSSMNPGAVAVQLAVVQLDSDQRDQFESFWGHLDQLKLPLAVRKTGDRNGLRYAVMSPQIPSILPSLLKSRELDLNSLDDLKRQMAEAGLIKSPSRIVLHQRIENDTGEDYEITTSDLYPQKRWSIDAGDGIPMTGFGQLVKGVYRFTGFPQPDGAVRLVMLPEIHHGISKHRFDVSQRTFLLNESQIKTKVTPLEFKVDLRPGESLIIAPTEHSDRFGDLLFGHQGMTPGAPNVVHQKSQIDMKIEQALKEIDTQVLSKVANIQPAINAGEGLEATADDNQVTHNRQPVTPLFRFLMIRLLHAQNGAEFDDDGGQRLTTVNHQ